MSKLHMRLVVPHLFFALTALAAVEFSAIVVNMPFSPTLNPPAPVAGPPAVRSATDSSGAAFLDNRAEVSARVGTAAGIHKAEASTKLPRKIGVISNPKIDLNTHNFASWTLTVTINFDRNYRVATFIKNVIEDKSASITAIHQLSIRIDEIKTSKKLDEKSEKPISVSSSNKVDQFVNENTTMKSPGPPRCCESGRRQTNLYRTRQRISRNVVGCIRSCMTG